MLSFVTGSLWRSNKPYISTLASSRSVARAYILESEIIVGSDNDSKWISYGFKHPEVKKTFLILV